MKSLKLCVLGLGQFSRRFIPLFQAHPLVSELSFCDRDTAKLELEGNRFGVTRRFADFEEMLRSDVDAVAVFTQRWMHAAMSLRALEAGKHVFCSVPSATTVEELGQLVETVRRTGLTYMMAETSWYYGARLFCKERWDAGEFGHFVYGEGEYLHDMSHGYYTSYQRAAGGPDWKPVASYPPMLYPTHSIAMILSITGARMTSVSCLGWRDRSDDGVFLAKVSRWGNEFSNQTALFRTSDGGMVRINEFRRVGLKGVRHERMSFFGTDAAFEEHGAGATYGKLDSQAVSVEDEIHVDQSGLSTPEQWEAAKAEIERAGDFRAGFARIHQKYRTRLPASFRTKPNGHEGSHQFLVDDFVTATAHGRLPPMNVWDAARINAPGIVAHESSQRDGAQLTIPDFGAPPAGFGV